MCLSQESADDEDRISSLPDDILITILSKMDALSAMTTTILSNRWHRLPQLHTYYDFDINDILPRRYHVVKRLHDEAEAGYEADKNKEVLTDYHDIKERYNRWMRRIVPLKASLERYKRRAMRRFVKRVNAFLLVPDSVLKCRSIQKLRLRTFGSNSCYWINQWIVAAIGRWKIEDLELIAVDYGFYNFDWLDGCRKVRLKSLTISNWVSVNAYNCPVFQRLTKLCLNSISCIGFGLVVRKCTQIKDLRLTSCCIKPPIIAINAPRSTIKNLHVDSCNLVKLSLFSMPCLETLVFRGQPTKIQYGDVPQLRHLSLDYLQPEGNSKDDITGSNKLFPLRKFFKRIPPIKNLVLQFRGPQMWIEQSVLPSQFHQLRRLSVANVHVEWNIFWILFLLDAAPILETLHVHIKSSEKENICEACTGVDAKHPHQYNHLKELVMVGFDGAKAQVNLVREIMKLSPVLRRVHLFDGDVEDDGGGLGDLKIVKYPSKLHECERDEIVDDLTNGICSESHVILE